jgi:hydrogenase maturation protease
MSTAKPGLAKPVLVLGLGNTLLKDDGFGPTLLERLRPHFTCADDVEFVDGGTIGLGLLTQLADRRAVLILDAFKSGKKPGTLIVKHALEPGEAGPPPGRSAHEGNASALLAVAAFTGDLPERVAVIGVEPDEIATGYGLTPVVEASLVKAEREALHLIEELLEVTACV